MTELNRNLIDLGFDPYGAITDDESFSEATADAVKRWQKAEGLPETGEVELGRVVFAPGARRVTDVKVTLGQDPPGATRPRTTPTTPAATSPAATSEPGAGKSPAKKPGSKSPGKGKESPGKGQPRKHPPKKSPPKNNPPKKNPPKTTRAKARPAENRAPAPARSCSATTSTQQIVQLKVKPEQQQLARLGETVTVQLPGGGEAPGHVTEVGTVASESKGSGSEEKGSPAAKAANRTIPVTITLDHPVAHLDEAPVSVELVKSIRRNVLTVPATALIATAGGGYAVEALEQDRRVTVPVTPGMFADGYVQVEGAGVREGMTVIESQ